MNLSDVKIGDRLRTEKGGVISVECIYPDGCIGGLNGGVWNPDGTPWGYEPNFVQNKIYGPIVGRENQMNYEKEITDLKARLAALEPKPEPKLPTEMGSVIKTAGLIFVLTSDSSDRPWVSTRPHNSEWWHYSSNLLEYCAKNGGFQIGRVVWEAE